MNLANPRSHFVFSYFLVFLLCVLCGDSAAQDFTSVHPGVEYAQVEHRIGDDPVKIDLLRLDPSKVRLDVVHAFDRAIGLETTSSMARRKGAIAAINAGFFRLDKSEFAGDAAGVLMIDGELFSESTNRRTAVSIQNTAKYSVVFFNRIDAYLTLSIGERETLKQFSVSGINRSLNKNEAVLYSPAFGPTTLTRETRFEVLLTGCKLGKLIGSFRDTVCKKITAVSGSRNMVIPKDGFVLAIGPDAASPDGDSVLREIEKIYKSGATRGTFRIRRPILLDGGQFTTDRNVDITNGVPRLIRDGKIAISWEEEKAGRAFTFNRHPRTAIAKSKEGKLLLITVDGRQPGVSVGMTLPELAEYLLSIGATDAMNLDGGGSTTMFLDGRVVNKPSDKEGERKVGDAIIVTLRNRKR